MEAAFGWLGTIFNFLISFFPHLYIVRSTHAGIKFKNGKEEIVMNRGLHWYWPLVTECEVVQVKYRTCDLPAQYLETNDGKSVGVGGIVAFEIEDIQSALCNCANYEDVIRDKGHAAIKYVVTKNDYSYFNGSDPDQKLTTRLQRELKDFGIAIRRVQLSDFVESQMFAIWGLSLSVSNGETEQ